MKAFRSLFVICVLSTISLHAQVAPKSATLSAGGGYFHNNTTTSGATDERYSLGASGGFNPAKYLGFFGEYNFDNAVTESVGNNKPHNTRYGLAARVYLSPKSRIVPYGVFGGGGTKLVSYTSSSTLVGGNTVTIYSTASSNGFYFGGGAGALIYFSRHWGIMPEGRYNRISFREGNPPIANINVFTLTASIFYQFGGGKRPAK